MSKNPTAKIDPAQEQRFRDNMVHLTRGQMFVDGESEKDCVEAMQWMVAAHVAIRDHVEWDDIQVLVEQLAVEVKPLASEIVERAKKAGRP